MEVWDSVLLANELESHTELLADESDSGAVLVDTWRAACMQSAEGEADRSIGPRPLGTASSRERTLDWPPLGGDVFGLPPGTPPARDRATRSEEGAERGR